MTRTTAKEAVHGVRFEDLSELTIDQVIALVEEAESDQDTKFKGLSENKETE